MTRAEPYMTAAQLADHLGVSVRTIRRWARRGMPDHRWPPDTGRTVRYLASEVERWGSIGGDNAPDDRANDRLA